MAAVQAVDVGSHMSVMFDENEQTKACHRLLSAVVVVALRDACSTPPKRGAGGMPISTDAFTAMRFFFDESVSGLNEYLVWFDIDPGQYRMRLLKTMSNDTALPVNGLQPLDRRNFRYNYRMWDKLKHSLPIDELEGEKDD